MESITIGGVTYSKDEAINLLKAPPAGDRTYKMFSSLACSILNIAIGNDPTCIEDAINSADEWMAQYGPAGSGVKPSSKAWKNCDQLCDYLDDYNNGRLCAPRRK